MAAAAALGLFAAACGDDEVESATAENSTSVVIDGELDCPPAEQRDPPAEVGGPGAPTPGEAIVALLGPARERLGGRIERFDEVVGTVVVDGRELLRVRVRESDEGGWIGLPTYCSEVAGAFEGTGNSTPRTEPPVTATG